MRLFAVVAFVCSLLAVPAFAANVGFAEVKVANGTEPPLTVGIWYPTNATAVEQTVGNVTETVARDAPTMRQ